MSDMNFDYPSDVKYPENDAMLSKKIKMDDSN